MGWFTSAASIGAYLSLAAEGSLEWYEDWFFIRSKHWWKKGKGDDDDAAEIVWRVIGITGLCIEVASWTMFYYSYNKSLSYAQYMFENAIETVEEEADETM